MADLEMELSHIRREKDYRYFLENARGIWHASVYENGSGGIDGFLVSVNHPGDGSVAARSSSMESKHWPLRD